jgi:DNA-binding PucR family transcriptional regulator
MKGQAALEFIAIVGIQLAVLALAWLYFNTNYQSTIQSLDAAKARDAVEKISATAQIVSLQGPPAKQTVVVDFPSNIQSVNVTGHEVLIKLAANGEAYAYSPVLLNGSVQTTAGTALITIEALQGVVQITG